MDPASIAVGTIAKLAFDAFIKSGAGEIAKQSVGGGIELVKTLGSKIRSKFQGNERAETALTELEEQGTQAALDKVAKYLDLEMMEDQTFGEEVRQIAHQIINIQNRKRQVSPYQIKQFLTLIEKYNLMLGVYWFIYFSFDFSSNFFNHISR